MESVLPRSAEPPYSEERALLAQVARGDEVAVAELSRGHRDGMYRLAYSLLGDGDEAADAAQAAMLRAVASAGKFDGRAPLRNWLLQFTLREAQKIARHRRWPRLSLERRDPRQPYAQIEAADALRRGMADLSPPLREAFVLVYVEELTVAETAVLLKIPEGTVKSRCHAARAALRRALEIS